MPKPSKSGPRHTTSQSQSQASSTDRETRIAVLGTLDQALAKALEKLVELSSQPLKDVEITGLITSDLGPVGGKEGYFAAGVRGGFPAPNARPLWELQSLAIQCESKAEDFSSLTKIEDGRYIFSFTLRLDWDQIKGEHVNLRTTQRSSWQKDSNFYSFELRPASEFDAKGKYTSQLPKLGPGGMGAPLSNEEAAKVLMSIPSSFFDTVEHFSSEECGYQYHQARTLAKMLDRPKEKSSFLDNKTIYEAFCGLNGWRSWAGLASRQPRLDLFMEAWLSSDHETQQEIPWEDILKDE